MMERKNQSSAGKIKALEKENLELHKKLKLLKGDEQEIFIYRLYLEVRKKLLTWVAGVIVVVTVFGFVSMSNIIKTIKDKIESRGIESIIEEIKQDFEEKHQSRIIDETISRLMPNIEAKVEEAVRSELINRFQKVESGIDKKEVYSLSEAFEESYDKERYMAIIASSPLPKDLENELNKMKNKIGTQFDNLFPDVKIYPPSEGNKNYALIIGSDLKYSEAKILQKKAMDWGFRSDTYLKRISSKEK